MTETEPAAVAQQLIERWNAGDVDGVVELYSEDAAMYAGEDWPDQAVYRGHDGVRDNIEQWRTVWESSSVELERLETFGRARGRERSLGHARTRQRRERPPAVRDPPEHPGWEDRKT